MKENLQRMLFAYLLLIMAMLGVIGLYLSPDIGTAIAWVGIAAFAAIGALWLLVKAVRDVLEEREVVGA